MHWRGYLTFLSLLFAVHGGAVAAEPTLTIGIFPGTGTADMLRADFRAVATPFADALAGAVGKKAKLTMFRTLKSTNRSMVKGRKDVYLAPPTVAVAAFNKGYSPIARVEHFIKIVLLRRKGADVKTVALTEKQSVPDVLVRYVLKQQDETARYMNVKTQADVILALKRNYAQAGAVNGRNAKTLLETGDFEVWHELPVSPGFTLVASDRLSDAEKAKLESAISSIDPKVIAKMQKGFISKLGRFVADKDAEFKTLQQAMLAAGYIDARE